MSKRCIIYYNPAALNNTDKGNSMKYILIAVAFGTVWLLQNLDDPTVKGIIDEFWGIIPITYFILIYLTKAYTPSFDGRTTTGYKDNIKPGFFGWVIAPFLCLLSLVMAVLGWLAVYTTYN